MADGTCDLGETPHARNWILTRLNPVLTVELCDEDFVPGIIGLLSAELGVEYGIVYGQLERMLKAEQKKADRALADAQAAEAAEGSQAPGQANPDMPLPKPPPGLAWTNDGVLVPDDEGGEL